MSVKILLNVQIIYLHLVILIINNFNAVNKIMLIVDSAIHNNNQ